MINREIPFRPRLEGEFRIRFYNAVTIETAVQPYLQLVRENDIILKRVRANVWSF